jgi:Fe-S cluster assembly iron-binding protein IscA
MPLNSSSPNPPIISLTKKAARCIRRYLKKSGIKSPWGGIKFSIKLGNCKKPHYFCELTNADIRLDYLIVSRSIRIYIAKEHIDNFKGIVVDVSHDKPNIWQFALSDPHDQICDCNESRSNTTKK